MPWVDLEAVEQRAVMIHSRLSWPYTDTTRQTLLTDLPALVARVRELEGIVSDLLRDNSELAHEVKARDPRCEAHPFEADDAGCAPCHAVRVRELEAPERLVALLPQHDLHFEHLAGEGWKVGTCFDRESGGWDGWFEGETLQEACQKALEGLNS